MWVGDLKNTIVIRIFRFTSKHNGVSVCRRRGRGGSRTVITRIDRQERRITEFNNTLQETEVRVRRENCRARSSFSLTGESAVPFRTMAGLESEACDVLRGLFLSLFLLYLL